MTFGLQRRHAAECSGLRAACRTLQFAGRSRLTREDYLVPTLQALQVKDDHWKFINLGIGANDIVSPKSHLQ